MNKLFTAATIAALVMTTGCSIFDEIVEANPESTVQEERQLENLSIKVPISEKNVYFKTVAQFAKICVYDGEKLIASAELDITEEAISGTVVEIPVGKEYVFKLEVFDSEGNVCYDGTTVSDIVSGSVTQLSILLTPATGSAEIIGVIEDLSSPSLLLHIPMDETVNDIGSYSFPVTNNGATFTTDKDGTPNSALYFSGNSYLEIPYNITLDSPNEFTLSAWAKSDLATSNYQEGFVVDMGYASDRHYAISYHSAYGGMNGGYNFKKIGTYDIDIMQWHHYALTYNGSTAIFYVDGEEVNRESIAPALIDDNPLRVGAQSKSLMRYWTGSIDDVRLYSNALSEFEVLSLQ